MPIITGAVASISCCTNSNNLFTSSLGKEMPKNIITKNTCAIHVKRVRKETMKRKVLKHEKPRTKKYIYERFWFWLVLIVLIAGIASSVLHSKHSTSTKNNNNHSSTNSTASISSEQKSYKTEETAESKALTSEEKALDGLTGNTLAQTEQAINYLQTLHLSKQGLYDQLTSEYGSQMTPEDANTVIGRLEPLVNWNNLAVLSAQTYRNTLSLTGQALLEQLTSEYGSKFPIDQAQYGVDHVDENIDFFDIWNK